MIVLALVHPATSPYSRRFGTTDARGFVSPRRFKSPNFNSDGVSHTSGASSTDSRRMPVPPYNRVLSVPASQNDAPLDGDTTPPMTVLSRVATRPLDAVWRAAQKFALPAPAPIRPPSVM